MVLILWIVTVNRIFRIHFRDFTSSSNRSFCFLKNIIKVCHLFKIIYFYWQKFSLQFISAKSGWKIQVRAVHAAVQRLGPQPCCPRVVQVRLHVLVSGLRHRLYARLALFATPGPARARAHRVVVTMTAVTTVETVGQ